MSRIARQSFSVPNNVTFATSDNQVVIDGPKGSITINLPTGCKFEVVNGKVNLSFAKAAAKGPANNRKFAKAIIGTTAAQLAKALAGVSKGFERKLQILGVGYRAQANSNRLNIEVGKSHPEIVTMPVGVAVATPTNTEIVLTGIDDALLGQVAANLRAKRRPNPYAKGKGIRYFDEIVLLKESKRKSK